MNTSAIEQTIEALKSHQTILYPTDTVWGIGCDARDDDAVRHIYDIKERDKKKSMLLLATEQMLRINDKRIAQLLLFSDRPTTVIFPHEIWRTMLLVDIADNLPADDGTIGIRVPKHTFCKAVMQRTTSPIVSTSANLSGEPTPISYCDISKKIFERVDYCVPPLAEFMSNEKNSSRIVRWNIDGSINVLRQ